MTNFTKYRISELCEFTNGFSFKSGDYIEKSKDTLEVFRMGYIERGGGFKEDSTPVFVPKKYNRDLSKYLLQKDDVLIAMTDMNNIPAGGAIPPEARVVDQPRIEAAIREILLSVGENPDRDGLKETPARVARMYAEIFGGLHVEPGRHLQKVFEEQYDEMVLVRDISFNSMCEHHLLPFMGKAHVGYIPRGKGTGLSKLARVVDEIARRPQVQERMTHMIADLIENELTAHGVIVVVEAEHTCMTIRGVKKPGALTVTSAVRGMFRNNLASRAEAMALINGK